MYVHMGYHAGPTSQQFYQMVAQVVLSGYIHMLTGVLDNRHATRNTDTDQKFHITFYI